MGLQDNPVQVNFTEKSGLYVEYWKYDYNLRNRLETVWKNEGDEPIAQFTYDSMGMRIKSEEEGRVVHYVYGLGNHLLYEKEIQSANSAEIDSGYETGDYRDPNLPEGQIAGTKSYIFAFQKTIAE